MDEVKEPTEGKIAEELIGNKPIRKHRLRQKWTPALFATFLLYHNPFLAWQDPIFVRKKFPNLFPKCSDKTASIKIGKLMNDPKFDHITAEYLKTMRNKGNTGGWFWSLLQKAVDTNMNLPVNMQPSVKLIEVVGKVSGEYDPTQTINIKGGMNLTAEQEKKISKVAEEAMINRLNRLKLEENGNGD